MPNGVHARADRFAVAGAVERRVEQAVLIDRGDDVVRLAAIDRRPLDCQQIVQVVSGKVNGGRDKPQVVIQMCGKSETAAVIKADRRGPYEGPVDRFDIVGRAGEDVAGAFGDLGGSGARKPPDAIVPEPYEIEHRRQVPIAAVALRIKRFLEAELITRGDRGRGADGTEMRGDSQVVQGVQRRGQRQIRRDGIRYVPIALKERRPCDGLAQPARYGLDTVVQRPAVTVAEARNGDPGRGAGAVQLGWRDAEILQPGGNRLRWQIGRNPVMHATMGNDDLERQGRGIRILPGCEIGKCVDKRVPWQRKVEAWGHPVLAQAAIRQGRLDVGAVQARFAQPDDMAAEEDGDDQGLGRRGGAENPPGNALRGDRIDMSDKRGTVGVGQERQHMRYLALVMLLQSSLAPPLLKTPQLPLALQPASHRNQDPPKHRYPIPVFAGLPAESNTHSGVMLLAARPLANGRPIGDCAPEIAAMGLGTEARERKLGNGMGDGDAMTSDDEKILFDVFSAVLFRRPTPRETEHYRELVGTEHGLKAALRSLLDSGERKSMERRVAYPPGHFYSPIVDPETVREHLAKQSQVESDAFHGIRIDLDGLDRLWRAAEPVFKSARWQEEPTEGLRYHFANDSFPFTDALMLRAMLHLDRPRRIVEIGAGYTTAAMLDTLDSLDGAETDITLVQPYPHTIKRILRPEDWDRFNLVEDFAQNLSRDFFMELSEGDILFIDSTHVVKTCSDVVWEIIEILPHLRPGVRVHFHDIFYPFEYRKEWVLDIARSWNEIYMLRAYLMENPNYETIMFNDYYVRFRLPKEAWRRERFLRNPGGSLWLRRI